MNRICNPVVAACAAFMAVALPAAAQDQRTSQEHISKNVSGHHLAETKKASETMAEDSFKAFEKFLDAEPFDAGGKTAKLACYTLTNDVDFRIELSTGSIGTELMRVAHVPARMEGKELVPVRHDKVWAYFTDVDALYEANKKDFYTSDDAFYTLTPGAHVGCADTPEELQGQQAVLNRQLLVNLRERVDGWLDTALKVRDQGPKPRV